MQARVIALRQERARQVDERRRQNPAANKVSKRPFQSASDEYLQAHTSQRRSDLQILGRA
jgi:hypothetical protein